MTTAWQNVPAPGEVGDGCTQITDPSTQACASEHHPELGYDRTQSRRIGEADALEIIELYKAV